MVENYIQLLAVFFRSFFLKYRRKFLTTVSGSSLIAQIVGRMAGGCSLHTITGVWRIYSPTPTNWTMKIGRFVGVGMWATCPLPALVFLFLY